MDARLERLYINRILSGKEIFLPSFYLIQSLLWLLDNAFRGNLYLWLFLVAIFWLYCNNEAFVRINCLLGCTYPHFPFVIYYDIYFPKLHPSMCVFIFCFGIISRLIIMILEE